MTTARLERFFCWLAIVLAFFLSLAYRHVMNPDLIAYIELGEEWWRGNIQHAIHGYWNPIFPILMAGAAKLAPSRFWEPTAMHLAFALTYLLVVWSFRKMLRELSHLLDRDEESWRALVIFGYPLFLWASFVLVRFQYLTPDVLVFAWVLLASNSLLRIARNEAVPKNSLLLGLFLGCGYLTKTVMFLLGGVYLGCLALTLVKIKRNVLWGAASAGVFAAVAAPHIVLLSQAHGHFTYGESGSMAYAWQVNKVSLYEPAATFEGDGPKAILRILDHPPTYKYSTDREVSYPLGYEPEYLHARKPRFDMGDQLRRLLESARFFVNLLGFTPVPVIALFSLVLLWQRARPFGNKKALAAWPIVIPGFAAMALYSLVYIETRYIAPFVLIALLVGFIWLHSPSEREPLWERALLSRAAGVITAAVVFSVTPRALREQISPPPHSHVVHAKVARELTELGVNAGDKVALIGAGAFAYFARIADVQIVAETPTIETVEWFPTGSNLETVAQTLRDKTSCEVLIFEKLSKSFWLPGAIDVESTPYAIYRLRN